MSTSEMQQQPILTILTPTWNRRHLLPRLYESLVAQDAPAGSFEWLIVDDGSTDGTAEWLESLVQSTPFCLRVIGQQNGGKHRALNRAARELRSPWTLIVDSDDWLLSRAVARAIQSSSSVGSDCVAIIAYRSIGGVRQEWTRQSKQLVDFRGWLKQPRGDTSIIMRAELFLEHPFHEFDGENFIAESSMWARAFAGGGILLSDDTLVAGEYQPDGLSSRSLSLRVQNPVGAIATYDAHLSAKVEGRQWIVSKLNFHRFYWHAKNIGAEVNEYPFRFSKAWLLAGYFFYLRDLSVLKG